MQQEHPVAININAPHDFPALYKVLDALVRLPGEKQRAIVTEVTVPDLRRPIDDQLFAEKK